MTTPIPILMYHSISDGEAKPGYRRYVIRPHSFEQQMIYIKENGLIPLTVSDFIRARSSNTLPERTVLITIDDGLSDFYDNALPILVKYGFSATLYVVTGFVGHRSAWLDSIGEGHRPMLTWQQIREISACGIECGAHTESHPELDVLPLDECRKEIIRSKERLETNLGCPVYSFAYPYGKFCRTVRQNVRDAGFSSACAVKRTVSSTDEDRFSLARIEMAPDVTIGTFGQWLRGHSITFAPKRDRLQTTAWRAVRRTAARLGMLNVRASGF